MNLIIVISVLRMNKVDSRKVRQAETHPLTCCKTGLKLLPSVPTIHLYHVSGVFLIWSRCGAVYGYRDLEE